MSPRHDHSPRPHGAGRFLVVAVLVATPWIARTARAELSPLGNARIVSSAGAVDGDSFGSALAVGDFDGDGKDDLAIGEWGYNGSTGQVEIYRGGAGGLLYEATLAGSTSSSFGRALAAGDFNGDGKDELAVGLPGYDGGEGRFEVYRRTLPGGVPTWTLATGAAYISLQPPYLLSGSYKPSLGSALAAGDFNGDGRDDLAMGAPWARPGDFDKAGAVAVVYGSATGIDKTTVEWWDQDSPSVPGVAEADDLFGSELAAGDFNCDGKDDLAVGAFGEDIGAVVDAGYVVVLYGSSSGLTGTGSAGFSQGSGGVPGAPEPTDYFGASLAVGEFDRANLFAPVCQDLAIGVPREDVDHGGQSWADAGAVVMLYGGASGLSATGSQLLTGFDLYGNDYDGHGFGDSLAAGRFNDDIATDLAIGVDDLPTTAWAAGAVLVALGGAGGIDPATARAYTESGLLVAPPRSDEQFAHALAAGNFNGAYAADLAVGIPKEQDTSTEGLGAVEILYSAPLPALISDGFETGSASAWSKKQP